MTRNLAWVLLIVAAAVAPAALRGQDLSMEGQRYKLTGRWDGESLRVYRLQTRDARRNPRRGQVEGRIASVAADHGSMRVGPLTVIRDGQTTLVGMSLADLTVGTGVEISGNLREPGVLLATSIERERVDGDAVALIGSVQSARPEPDGGMRLVVLGVDVIVPVGTRSFAQGLTRDPDDRRPEQQLRVRLFGRPVSVSGGLDQRLLADGGRTLVRADDDRIRLEQGLKLEVFWPLTNTIGVFVEGAAGYESELYREGGGNGERVWTVEGGQAWLYAANIFNTGLGLQVGRQRFREQREWWWDDNLDAVRVRYAHRNYAAELAIAKPVQDDRFFGGEPDPEKQDQRVVIGNAGWAWHPDHRVDLFGLWLRDGSPREPVAFVLDGDQEDELDPSLWWAGLRASGDFSDDFGSAHYWANVAGVAGREDRREFAGAGADRSVVTRTERGRVLAWAAEAGVTMGPHAAGAPSLTLSYAVGSGDRNPDDDIDGNFRQTGMHDNNGRFNGVNRFRYYGEMYRPELSNMQIVTAGLGWSLLGASSVEFVWHRYDQLVASRDVRDVRLRMSPNGVGRHLGDELDVVLGIEEWDRVEVEVIGAVFRSGPAYETGTVRFPMYLGLKLDWNF